MLFQNVKQSENIANGKMEPFRLSIFVKKKSFLFNDY